MAFGNPFVGNYERTLTKEELIQALRYDIAGELEAIYGYEAHYMATEDATAKEILGSIRDEEKTHIGELMTLLRHLDPDEKYYFDRGVEEALRQIGQLS